MMKRQRLLDVKGLSIEFSIEKERVRAIDQLSFTLDKGEVLGIVGESGSGKSISVTALMKLLPPNARIIEGEIHFNGQEIVSLNERAMRKIRGNQMSMIFQDPMTSLNPVYTIGNQLVEVIRLHQNVNRKAAREEAIKLLTLVGIKEPEKRLRKYPHEFSGGMRQRVMIAMAVASNPALIIADEPTTALDVTVQAQILALLQELKEKINTSIIFISHDLEVVADIANRIVIMYAGQIVESGDTQKIFANPLHPYTRLLIKSIPKSNKVSGKLPYIRGNVPHLKDIPQGRCRFADRIPWIPESAHEKNPTLHEVEAGHFVRCTCYQHFVMKEELTRGDGNE